MRAMLSQSEIMLDETNSDLMNSGKTSQRYLKFLSYNLGCLLHKSKWTAFTGRLEQIGETDSKNNDSVVTPQITPARLGKGQGAKEIGHNLVRKQHKIEDSLERE